LRTKQTATLGATGSSYKSVEEDKNGEDCNGLTRWRSVSSMVSKFEAFNVSIVSAACTVYITNVINFVVLTVFISGREKKT
jgi:hypothetical protein